MGDNGERNQRDRNNQRNDNNQNARKRHDKFWRSVLDKCLSFNILVMFVQFGLSYTGTADSHKHIFHTTTAISGVTFAFLVASAILGRVTEVPILGTFNPVSKWLVFIGLLGNGILFGTVFFTGIGLEKPVLWQVGLGSVVAISTVVGFFLFMYFMTRNVVFYKAHDE